MSGRPALAKLRIRLTPFDFLTAIEQHSLDGILHHVKQDILLTESSR
jgi:hypothetical protein